MPEGLHQETKYERNTERKQDVIFVRSFLQQMDQIRVMRWRKEPQASFLSEETMKQMPESDAEHTGQMHSLFTGIMLKAIAENDSFASGFDTEKARAMIGLHDIEENLIGDARQKDENYYQNEELARNEIFRKLDDLNFGETIKAIQREYLERSTKEARFVKALDEIQAWFYLIYTKRFQESTRDFSNPSSITGYECALEFRTLKRIADILLFILQHPSMIKDEIVDLELLKEQYG